MDTIVFDIETKNFFTDSGVGWNNYSALEISVLAAYSYGQNKYFCFEEGEHEKIASFFEQSWRLAGFSMNRYDVPVLQNYLFSHGYRSINLWSKERVDLLEEIELATGRRISLDLLARANLGRGKIGSGAHAVDLYKEGRLEELKLYCKKDVELTKELFDLYSKNGFLMVPRGEEIVKVDF